MYVEVSGNVRAGPRSLKHLYSPIKENLSLREKKESKSQVCVRIYTLMHFQMEFYNQRRPNVSIYSNIRSGEEVAFDVWRLSLEETFFFLLTVGHSFSNAAPS